MKRVISVAVALVLCITLLPFSAYAGTYVVVPSSVETSTGTQAIDTKQKVTFYTYNDAAALPGNKQSAHTGELIALIPDIMIGKDARYTWTPKNDEGVVDWDGAHSVSNSIYRHNIRYMGTLSVFKEGSTYYLQPATFTAESTLVATVPSKFGMALTAVEADDVEYYESWKRVLWALAELHNTECTHCSSDIYYSPGCTFFDNINYTSLVHVPGIYGYDDTHRKDTSLGVVYATGLAFHDIGSPNDGMSQQEIVLTFILLSYVSDEGLLNLGDKPVAELLTDYGNAIDGYRESQVNQTIEADKENQMNYEFPENLNDWEVEDYFTWAKGVNWGSPYSEGLHPWTTEGIWVYGKLNNLRRVQLAAALAAYDSVNNYKSSFVEHFHDDYSDTGSAVAGDREIIKSTASRVRSLVGELGYSDVNALVHMHTWTERLKLFANLAMLSDGLTITEADFARQYTREGGSVYGYYLGVPYVTTEKIDAIRNFDDYVRFLETANELATFRYYIAEVIVNKLDSGYTTFASIQSYITALQTIYEGLVYIDSEELWNVWRDTLVDPKDSEAKDENGNPLPWFENYPTLESVYNKLMELNAFDGLKDYEGAEGQLYGRFFSISGTTGVTLSADLLYGMSLSATYTPMQTSMYDPYLLMSIENQAWVGAAENDQTNESNDGFHELYGFYRKALYIDTAENAASTLVRTGSSSALKVATLRDLMVPEADIVLYVDDNLYNVAELAALQDKAWDRLDNVDKESTTANFFQNLWQEITDYFTVDIREITKTAEEVQYEPKLLQTSKTSNSQWSNYFLNTDSINMYLNDTEYSLLQAFAHVSAVYRDEKLFKLLNKQATETEPVFVSSPQMPYLVEANAQERNSIFNYLLLKNLQSMMTVDYATSIDLDAPIFMDIYGNILTESGLVVIPAAANATLHDSDYVPYNAALLSTYGQEFTLEYNEDATEVNKTLEKMFTVIDGEWQVKALKLQSGDLDTSRLSTMDVDTMDELRDLYTYDLNHDTVRAREMAYWISEVLRGAPIEEINYDAEGINPARRLSVNGLAVAGKLENLLDALDSKNINTTIALPNLAFIEGVEYVVLFAYKLLILFVIIVWMITIYVDAVGTQVSWKTFGKCLGILLLVLSLIIVVPASFELTYYQSNKLLLQKETEYIMMLNLEKRSAGREIGINTVDTPDLSTELYLKLDSLDLKWYDVFDDVLFSSTFATMEEVYMAYNEDNFITDEKNIVTIDDGVYISTDDLFDSTSIDLNPTRNTLYQTARRDTPASFYTPYYAFLDSIIGNVNNYNRENNVYAYTTKIQSGGKVKTVGLIRAYLTSTDFMASQVDIFDIASIYGKGADSQEVRNYSESDVERMRASQWCNTGLSEEQVLERAEILNNYAKQWIAEHRQLIGKISDETFLKTFALSCAIKHNQLFNTQRADAIEIFNLSNEDLLRLSMDDAATVMYNSTSSYARYVYDVAGTPGVYAAALLAIVSFVGSWVKPLATIAVFVITCISIFVFKLLLRRESRGLYGYFTTIAILCSVNVLHSLFLKFSMYLPKLGMTPTVSLVVQIVLQVAYMFILIWVIGIAAKDWRNMGFTKHMDVFNHVTGKYSEAKMKNVPKHKDGWEYYYELVERQKRRVRRL